jgi:hypothetical protein
MPASGALTKNCTAAQCSLAADFGLAGLDSAGEEEGFDSVFAGAGLLSFEVEAGGGASFLAPSL